MSEFVVAGIQLGKLLLADGAWGTNLMSAGLDVSTDCAEHWNLTRPEQVRQLAAAFHIAGAQVSTTNTFGANRIRLARFGLEKQLVEINATGLRLTRDATHHQTLIAASMGPTGLKDILSRRVEIFQAFAEHAQVLVDNGADVLLLETMTSPEEAEIALEALHTTVSTPVVCSYAFTRGSSGDFTTWSGATVESALLTAQEGGAFMVGANCLPADDALDTLLTRIHATTPTLPIWLKPNAGSPIPRDGEVAYARPVHLLPLSSDRLTALNVAVLGGCCGTTPAHIGHLRERRAAW